jgi:hypothetical protein
MTTLHRTIGNRHRHGRLCPGGSSAGVRPVGPARAVHGCRTRGTRRGAAEGGGCRGRVRPDPSGCGTRGQGRFGPLAPGDVHRASPPGGRGVPTRAHRAGAAGAAEGRSAVPGGVPRGRPVGRSAVPGASSSPGGVRPRMPRSYAAATAVARSRTPNLPYRWVRWVLTVASLMKSSRAVSRFEVPLATSSSTSRSRAGSSRPAGTTASSRPRAVSVATRLEDLFPVCVRAAAERRGPLWT